MKRTPLRRKTPLKAGGKRLRAKKPGRKALKTVVRSAAHLAWIREQPCHLRHKMSADGDYHICKGSVVPMHIRLGTDGGTGLKPSDHFTVPGCQLGAHKEEHEGARTFARRWGVTKETAIEYARRSDYRHELGEL